MTEDWIQRLLLIAVLVERFYQLWSRLTSRIQARKLKSIWVSPYNVPSDIESFIKIAKNKDFRYCTKTIDENSFYEYEYCIIESTHWDFLRTVICPLKNEIIDKWKRWFFSYDSAVLWMKKSWYKPTNITPKRDEYK